MFCDVCGAETASPPTQPSPPASGWECCAIDFQEREQGTGFVVVMIGSEERDLAYRRYLGSPNHVWLTQAIVQELIDELVADGWQSFAEGNEWYNQRFCRPVNH